MRMQRPMWSNRARLPEVAVGFALAFGLPMASNVLYALDSQAVSLGTNCIVHCQAAAGFSCIRTILRQRQIISITDRITISRFSESKPTNRVEIG